MISEKSKWLSSISTCRLSTAAKLAILATILLVYLSARNAGMYPTVFADEWFYNLFSRIYDIKYSQRPSYLYYRLYGITSRCGDGFLECARLINVLFFVATIPLIYSLARKYLSKLLSMWITLLSVFSPINAYSAYFMPESMYFFGFFLFAWLILKGANRKPLPSVIFAGCTLGAMSMVKVHAIFLMAGLWMVILVPLLCRFNRKNAQNALWLVLVSVAAFLSFRLGVGYLFAGVAGLDILGTDYTATAKAASGVEQVRQLLPLIGYNLWGNILAVSVIFALPLALLLNINITGMKSDDEPKSDLLELKIFTGTLLFLLIAVTAIFFARVQGTSPYENIARLSLRYYDFIFPLLLIIVGVSTKKNPNESNKHYLCFTFIGVAIVAAYAVWSRMGGYIPAIADSPELTAFTYNPYVFVVLGVLGILCLLIALFRLRLGALIYLWVVLPLTIVFSAYFINQEMRMRLIPDAYDEAGQFVQRYLGADVAKLAIVAPELASLYRAHFYMQSQKTVMINLPNNNRITSDVLPDAVEWLLMLGPYENPFSIKQSVNVPVKANIFNLSNLNILKVQEQVEGYTLVHIDPIVVVDFLQEQLPVLLQVDGLSALEPIGRWSTGKVVELTFLKPLPKHFEMSIEAAAFGQNVGQPMTLEVGGKRYSMTLGSDSTKVNIPVASDYVSNKLKIIIPKPVSPKRLGLSEDTRSLGVALKTIKIRKLHEDVRFESELN